MGLGDNLMASGMAKGAHARGKRIAFGDGKAIIWDYHSEQIFKGNPNIAPRGSENDADIEWIPFYRGNRIYNRQSPDLVKWVWNERFKAIPGELYFTPDEHSFADRIGKGFVAIEPNVPDHKSVANNKRWGTGKYDKVARYLAKDGYDVRQFNYGPHRIPYATQIKTPNFRHAARVLKNAALYIGPEGGLHHAAAALGVPAVVIFGGFIPAAITGYDGHTNLTGGAIACGNIHNCTHCVAAMEAIGVDEVHEAALSYLRRAA